MKRNLFELRQREICILSALLLSMCATILTGCKSKQEVTNIAEASEQHLVAHSTMTVTPDTIVYQLAPQYIERVVYDSVSVLQNDYAESRVSIQPDGTMLHSLDSRDRIIYVPVQTVRTVTDTVYSTSSQKTEKYPVNTSRGKSTATRWWIIILAMAAGLFLLIKKFARVR